MSLETSILIGFNAQAALSGFPAVANAATQMGAKVEASGASFQQLSSQANASKSALTGLGTGYQQSASSAQQAGSAATQFTGALRGVQTGASSTGQSFGTLTTSTNTANAATKTYTGALGSFNSALTPVQGGLTKTNTVLGSYSTVAQTAQEKSVGLGTKIGLVGGFATNTVGSVFSLVEGYTSMEKASVMADRAQVMLIGAQKTVLTTQDALTKAVQQYGPSSRQAAEATLAHQKAEEALGVAQERAALASDRAKEAQVQFALGVVGTISNLVTMGSTLAALRTELGLTSAAQAESAGATVADAAAMEGEAAAAGTAAVATGGLATALLAIAAPIVAAVALIALIETNTFGMGDAFRATTVVIAKAIDTIVNTVHTWWNSFVEILNNLSGFHAQVNNMFLDIANGIITALNGAIAGAQKFVTDFENTLAVIPNWIITNVLNKIIDAFNTFSKGLETSFANILAPIENIWKSGLTALIDTVVGWAQKVNGALAAIHLPQIDLKPLTDLQYHLHNSGTAATDAGAQVEKSFKPIPAIPKITTDVTNLHTQGLIPLIGGYQDAGAASQKFNGLLQNTHTTTAQAIADSVNYYSKWENVSKVLQTNVSPAIQQVIKYLFDHVAGAKNAIASLLGLQSAEGAAGKEIKGNSAALNENSQLATKNVDALKTLQDANSKTSSEIESFAKNIENSAFVQALQTKGTNEQIKALNDLQAKNISETASLAEYNKEIDNGTITTAKYTEGLNAQQKALADMQTETANMLGKLVELDNELETGANTVAVYDNAWVKAETEFQNGFNKITELDAQIAVLNSHIQDGTAFTQAYAKGLREGTIEFDNFLTSTVEGAAKQEVFNTALNATAQAFGGLPSFMEPTIENVKTFVEAMLGSAEAAQKMKEELTKAFSGIESDAAGFVSDIAGKFKDLNENVKKPFADLPDYIAKAMTPDDKAMILAAARGEALGKQITGPFSAIMATEGPAAAANFLEGVQSGLKNFDDRAALQPIIDGLRSGTAEGVLAATQQLERLKDPMKGVAQNMASTYLEGLAQWPRDTQSAVDKAIAVFSQLPGSAGEKAQMIAKIFSDLHLQLNDADIQHMSDQLGIPFNTLKAAAGSVPGAVQQPLNQTGGEIDAFVNAAVISTQAFQLVQTNIFTVFDNIGVKATETVGILTPIWTQIATEASNAFVLIQTNITNAFSNIGTLAAGIVGPINDAFSRAQSDATGYLNTLLRDATNTFRAIGQSATGVVGPVNNAFARAQSDATGYLNTILRDSQNTFRAVGTAANVVVGPVSSAFSGAQRAATTALNAISSTAKTAFDAVSRAADSAATRVSSAMGKIVQSANQAAKAVQAVASQINSLRDKTVTITVVTVYRTVGSPSGFQRGGLITGGGAAARTPFITSRQQNYRGHIIGEAGKPEIVMPLSKNPGDLADKSIDIKSQLKKSISRLAGDRDANNKSQQGGKQQEVTVKGTVTNNVPININIDGKRIMSTVQRQLLEFSDATV